MKQITIISFLILSFFGYSQDWREDTLILFGRAKSVHYESTLFFGEDEEDWWTEDNIYEYNENGFLLRKNLSSSMSGPIYNGTFRKFNKDGNLCLEEYSLYENDTSSRYIFEYNETGQTNKITLYNLRSHWSTFYYLYNNEMIQEYFVVIQRDKDTIRNLFEYDDNHNKIKESHISSSNIVITSWEYDQNGNLIQEKSELLKSPPTTIFTIENDGSRNEEVMESNPDDDRNYLIEFSYNDIKQKTREIKSYLDGRTKYDIVFEYNQNGDIVSEYYLDLKKKNGERIKKTIVYEYDSYANWIKKQSYFGKELNQEETRIIVYY